MLQVCGEIGTLYTVDGNVKCFSNPWEARRYFPQKLSIPYDPGISLLSIELKAGSLRDVYTLKLIAPLYIIAKIQEQPQCHL